MTNKKVCVWRDLPPFGLHVQPGCKPNVSYPCVEKGWKFCPHCGKPLKAPGRP